MAGAIGMAVIGLGRAGSIHFRNVIRNPRVNLKYLVEDQVNIAETLIRDHKLQECTRAYHVSDLDTVLNDPSIHACVIATPTDYHELFVQRCLNAGKAVLCEKPLAKTIDAIARCYDKADEMNTPLICSFNRRFDPGVISMFQRVRSGDVGQVQIIKCTSKDHHVASIEYLRTSGGIYHDSAVHTIDLTCWLFGERPTTVYATGHSFIKEIREINDIDTTAIVLKFPSGGIGIIDMSRFAAFGYDNRLEVFGSKGMLLQGNCKPTTVEFCGVNGETTDPIYDSFFTRYPQSFVNVMDHFLNVIEGKEKPSITRRSTVMVSQIADACSKSLASGKEISLDS